MAAQEYDDVAEMFRQLKALQEAAEPAGAARQRDAIAVRTLPLAEHIARRYRNRGEPAEDLLQVARVGLLNAIDRFDVDGGTHFVSFAVPTIMGELRRYFRDHCWDVKVPRGLKDLQLPLRRARTELSHRLGRAPTASEIADHLGIDRQLVVEAAIAENNYKVRSTDMPVHAEGRNVPLAERLGSPDPGIDKVVDMVSVRPAMAALPERLRVVLELRFFEGMTQSKIAEQIGCSQMQVSRLLTQALKAMRSSFQDADFAATG